MQLDGNTGNVEYLTEIFLVKIGVMRSLFLAPWILLCGVVPAAFVHGPIGGLVVGVVGGIIGLVIGQVIVYFAVKRGFSGLIHHLNEHNKAN